MPDPGVSLFPQRSKSTKKKRTNFRPASKKSNQSKNKITTGSSGKASKAIIRKNEEEQPTTTSDVAASKLPAQADSAQITTSSTTSTSTTAAAASAAATITAKNYSAIQPLSSSIEGSASQSPDKEENNREDEIVSEKEATASIPKTGSKEPAPSGRTRASDAIASASAPITVTKISTRKRKSISIGSSFRREKEMSDNASVAPIASERKNDVSGEKHESSTAMVPFLKPKDGEGKENDPKASALEAKKNALTAALATSNCIVPAMSARDQAILNQLAGEERQEEDKALNSFCTPFKGPKRRLKDKGSAKNPNKKENGDPKDVANGATKDAADSAAANSDKPIGRVDALTAGAPSVQIIDGEIVLQESSVLITSRRSIQEVEEEYRDNVVEEDEQLNIVTASYTSFVTKGDSGKTRKKGSWNIEETEKFYYALQQLGTDFGSMEALFFENQRTRKQLKNKYRKELAKTPDLVQELALNPKYQTPLDMSALNLEVDPKRIEAHENEEPPAYEPTDGDEIEMASSAKSKATRRTNGTGNDYNGVFDELEVVEEDAEEEERAEALALLEANKATTTASSPSEANNGKDWSATGEDQNESGFGEEADSGMGGFRPESGEGPSMDDFFGDSFVDDNETTKKEEIPITFSEAAAVTKIEAPVLVSLVPKKTNSKSRRPKIRPSRRKK